MKPEKILALGTIILIGLLVIDHIYIAHQGGCTKDSISFGGFKYEGSSNC